MSDVFISYARSTAKQARGIAEALRALGYGVWRDDELPAHRAFGEVIEERLKSAKAVVVIWSAEAAKSHWVRAEADFAREAGTLVQLSIDGAIPPMPFNQIQCADMKGWSGDRDAPGWRKVVDSIAELAGAAPVASPPGRGRLRRGPLAVGAVGLVGLVLVIAATLFVMKHGPRERGVTAPAASSNGRLPPEASVAVLPFANLSGDPGKRYFSDGISDELIGELARVPSLIVAARTSSFALEGKSQDVRLVAKALNVRNVLDGSVSEDGDRVRVEAELVNGANGFTVWSQRYDRKLSGILKLQDDIARAITLALTHQLLGAAAAGAGRTGSIDPQAYREYLEGQYDLGPRTKEGVARAVTLFRQVTTLQPDFAEGFAALARALINQAEDQPGQKGLMADAHAQLETALRLDPDNLNALASHLDLALHELDWQTAGRDAKRMESISPHSWAVLHEMSRYYQFLGFPDAALTAARGAARLDPLSFVDRLNVTSALLHNGRFVEAASAARAALALEPDQTSMLAMLCTAYAHSRRLGDARAVAAQLSQGKDSSDRDGCMFDIAVGEDRLLDARKINDLFASHFPDGDLSATNIGDAYAETGDFDQATRWLERAYDGREFELFIVAYDKAIRPGFFATAGWKALFNRPRFRDWRAAHDRVAAQGAPL